MSSKLDVKFLWGDSRAQVYLLWAAITGVGYTVTNFYQRNGINTFWLILAVIGFGYMYKLMPLRVDQMKKIYVSWLVPIFVGVSVSVMAAPTALFSKVLDVLPFLESISDSLIGLTVYLGAFWLVVQAFGFFFNGLVDAPSTWYYFAAGVNLSAAGLCYLNESAQQGQYLIAAIVSVWSMLMLWIYRADA
jgi:hypothetical protein